MIKRILLTLMCLITSLMSWGYAVNETFYAYDSETQTLDESILYYVVDADPTNLCCGVALCNKTGDVEIPATVRTDQNVTFKVTNACAGSNSAILKAYGQPYSASVTSLKFNENLTTLEVAGFKDCGAKTLELPSTLTTINTERNKFCPSLNKITITSGSSYTVVKSKEGADCILGSNGNDLVYACRYIEGTTNKALTLTFPDGVKTCNSYLMKQTPYIQQINLDAAFESFKVNTYLNETAFSGNSNLKKITVNAGNKKYIAYDGILYMNPFITLKDNDGNVITDDDGNEQKIGETLVCCPQGKYSQTATFKVPKGVITIGQFAFLNCNAKSIIIYKPIKTIKLGAFYNCLYLNPTNGFNFPATVTTIEDKALSSCTSLTKITVNTDNDNYIADDDGVLYKKDYTTLLACPAAKEGSYTVNSATTTIAEAAFASSKLTTIGLSEATNLATIKSSAFSGASVTSLEIPASVTWMGYRSLGDMASLTTLTFDGTKDSPNMEVDDRWFSGTNKVTDLVLPANLVCIAKNSTTDYKRTAINATNISFAEGSKLESIYDFESTFNDSVRTIDLSNCTSLRTLPADFCANLTELTKVVLPPNVETISSRAFFNTPNCTSVTFPENSTIKTIGANAFQQCGVESISLPSTVETIGKEAFAYCTKLEEVDIPKAASSISPEAFKFCTSLTKFTVDAANTNYAALDGILCSKDKKTLEIFPPGKARDTFTLLPPTFTKIGEYSFYYCQNLKNIVIPKKVTTIGNFAFEFCNNLNSITFLTDTPPSQLETDVATDNAKEDTNLKDHRFGNADETPAQFLKNHVTINIRTNGHQGEYKADGSYWKDCAGYTYSFRADASNSGRTDITNGYDYLAMSDNTVGVLKSYSTCNTAVVPATVTYTDEKNNSKSYSVGMIADYAFEDISENVKEMVFLGPIEFVGSNAFNNGHYDANGDGEIDDDEYHDEPTSNIERIFFTDYKNTGANELSTVRFELGEDYGTEEYPEFASTQKIYVPKSKLSKYQEDWSAFEDQIAYQIPLGMKEGSKYGTFSREFDVDLKGDDFDESNPKVLAFTGKIAEYPDAIRMLSINCTQSGTKQDAQSNDCDGTYIPANTGVLLKSFDTSKTDNYYRIGELEKDYPDYEAETGTVDNVFKSVVEDKYTFTRTDGTAASSDDDAYFSNLFCISGDKYYKCYVGMEMPVHKSYFQFTPTNAAKGITFLWDNEGLSETSIKNNDVYDGENVIYDLTGRRVQNASAKGVYIVNGKKIYVK